MLGQSIRLNKLVNKKNNCVIAALDAGGFFGPYPGLIDIKAVCSNLIASDAILIEPGNIEICKDIFLTDNCPMLITRMNWNTDYCFQWKYNQSRTVKSLSPQQALAMGAEIGIASLSIGTKDEEVDAENVKLFAGLIEEAMKVGIPIIGEIYPAIKDYDEGEFHDLIYKSARIATELGANAIKTFYTGDKFSEIARSVPVPMFVLGGEKRTIVLDSLKQVEKAVKDGAKGVVFGRNLYQAKEPKVFLKALKDVVNLKINAESAVEKYKLT